MTMKAILVPVEESDSLTSMLECSLLVAKRFNSYIEGLHVRAPLTGVMVADGAGAVNLMENFERQDQERAERAKTIFDTFCAEKNIPMVPIGDETEAAPDIPSGIWLEEVSPDDQAVGTRGRLFDLIVVGRPIRGKATPTMGTLETALFESGRPLIIAPPTAPSALGESIVIAWNGSTETARTIAFAMPFLNRAKRISVLTIDGVGVPGPSGDQVAKQLRRNGLDASAVTRPRNNRNPGEAMMDEATDLGADMVIKGAYTNSRLRQMIFGGATSYILNHANLPVFMAH